MKLERKIPSNNTQIIITGSQASVCMVQKRLYRSCFKRIIVQTFDRILIFLEPCFCIITVSTWTVQALIDAYLRCSVIRVVHPGVNTSSLAYTRNRVPLTRFVPALLRKSTINWECSPIPTTSSWTGIFNQSFILMCMWCVCNVDLCNADLNKEPVGRSKGQHYTS